MGKAVSNIIDTAFFSLYLCWVLSLDWRAVWTGWAVWAGLALLVAVVGSVVNPWRRS